MNLIDPILFQCKWQPMGLALFAPKTMFNSVTYGQLEKYIHNVGRAAKERGLERGKVVALFIKDPILHAVLILGLTKIGVVTVSGREWTLPRGLKVDVRLVDAPRQASVAEPVIVADRGWTEGPGIALAEPDSEKDVDDAPCRIILTSGSSGESKAVLRTNRHTIMRVLRWPLAFGNRVAECSRIYLDLGLSTGVGLTWLIYTLWKGGTVFMNGGDPIEMIGALSTFQVQGIIAAPKDLADITNLCDKIPSFRSYLNLVATTGSALPRVLAERARARLCSNLVSCYGSTEASITATAPFGALPAVDGAVGHVVPGVSVDIVSPSGASLPAGQEGLIRIRTSLLVDGYIGDPEATRRHFRDGGFYPGDMGTMTTDGVLVIRGRQEAVINVGGDKVSPERIEAALGSFGAVKDAAALAALSQSAVPIVIAAVVWHDKPDESGLLEHLQRHVPQRFIPKALIAVDLIPRNAGGKIDRQRLKELIAQKSGRALSTEKIDLLAGEVATSASVRH